MTPTDVICSQADAARGILEDFGPKSDGYLIGEKFLNFLEVAETDHQWRQAIPAFVAEIKALFEPLGARTALPAKGVATQPTGTVPPPASAATSHASGFATSEPRLAPGHSPSWLPPGCGRHLLGL
jgi:hypothetical protein